MANIIYRGTKPTTRNTTDGPKNGTGAPLTNPDIDGNFFTLDADKLDKLTTAAQTVASPVTFSGNVIISGDLTVSGDTTTLNVATLDVEDKNIVLANGATTDGAANGGGITLKGASNKTFNWVQPDSAWTSSEHVKLAAGKNVVLSGATSGTVTLATPAAAGSTTITFPATTGNVITSGDSGTVATAMIADLNVTTNKIADLNVTTNKIADLNVTTNKIADLNVTAGKIANGAVTIAKGGVGFTTYAAGDIIYANADNSLAKLPKGTDGQVLKLSGGVPSWGTDIDTNTNTTYTLDGSDKLIIGQATIDLVAGGSGSGTDSVTLIGRFGNQYLWSESSQELYAYGGFSPTYVTRSDLTTKTAFAAPGSQGGTITISNITQEDALTLESHLISGTVLFVSGCTGSFVNNNGNYLVNTCVATLNGASSSVVITLSSFVKSVQVTASAGAAGNTPQLMYVRKNEDVNGIRYSKYGGTGYDTYAKGDLLVGLTDGSLGRRSVGSNGQVLKVVNGDATWSTDNDTTYSAATDSVLGLVKLRSATAVADANVQAITATANRTYGIQANVSGQLVVNVPWVDTDANTTYSIKVSAQTNGAGLDLDAGGSGSGTDTVKILGSTGTTVTRTDADTITISSTSVGDGTLTTAAVTNGATNTTVALNLSGAYSANTTNNRTINPVVGPAITNLAALMTSGNTGFIRRTGQDTYSIDTNTYLTSYSETSTLATVLGRGNSAGVNSTDSFITFPSTALGPFFSPSGFDRDALVFNHVTPTYHLFDTVQIASKTSYIDNFGLSAVGSIASIKMGFGGTDRVGRIEFGNMCYGSNYGNSTYPIIMRASAANGASAILEVTSGEIRSPIYYEYGNTAYYLDLGNTGTSLNTAGSIIAGGNLTANSDRRLKTDIRVIENALDKVHKITGVTFDRIDNPDVGRQTGVIAQEVKEVLPEAVTGNEESYYSVAYGNMVGLLVEAIKELNAKVEDLQKQLSNK